MGYHYYFIIEYYPNFHYHPYYPYYYYYYYYFLPLFIFFSQK